MRKYPFNFSFAFVLVLSACSSLSSCNSVVPASLTASPEVSISSPTPVPPAGPTITLTPFPLNEEGINQAIVLEAPYLDLLQPLAELWPRQPFVTGMAFDPATGLVVLGTGSTFDPVNEGFRGAGGQTQIQPIRRAGAPTTTA